MPGLASAFVLSAFCLTADPAPPVLIPATTVSEYPTATSWQGDDRKDLYMKGIAFPEFLEQAERRRDRWVRNYENAMADEDLLARARAVGGNWKLLAVAIDGCSDSVSTIPYIARLVEGVENLEMRIVDSTVGRDVMMAHRTPDGRAATPTLVLLDEAYEEVGCFVERPLLLQDWVSENREGLDDREYVRQKFAWYDNDAGRNTLEEIVGLLEAAAEGTKGCGSG